MRRVNVHLLLSADLYPAMKNAAARKHERVRAVYVDDSQLKIAVKGCGRYGLPIHGQTLICPALRLLIFLNRREK